LLLFSERHCRLLPALCLLLFLCFQKRSGVKFTLLGGRRSCCLRQFLVLLFLCDFVTLPRNVRDILAVRALGKYAKSPDSDFLGFWLGNVNRQYGFGAVEFVQVRQKQIAFPRAELSILNASFSEFILSFPA
jgi:hypothetical protein